MKDYAVKELTDLSFERIAPDAEANYSLDLHTLNILWAMDGKRTIGTIALEDHYDLKELTQKVKILLETGLIVESQGADHMPLDEKNSDDPNEANAQINGEIVDKEFVDYLLSQLSQIIGPFASIVIEDAEKKTGFSLSACPVQKIKHLVHAIIRQISSEDSVYAFQEAILNKLHAKKYG